MSQNSDEQNSVFDDDDDDESRAPEEEDGDEREEGDAEEQSEDDMWEVILDDTVHQYNEQLQQYADNVVMLKKKFEKYFFENVRTWIHKLYNFYEYDEVFGKLVEYVKNLDHADDDEEALNLAVDNKKYRILKVVDWTRVFSLIDTTAEEEDNQ